jgi:uncharacterized membrane protein
MQIKTSGARQGWVWISAGWRLFQKDYALWLTMALIYLIMAIVLDQIPFIGYLLLILITPVFAAGALLVSAELDAEPVSRPGLEWNSSTWKDNLKKVFARALKQLFRLFQDPEKTLAVMVVATLALGAAVIIQILTQLLKVGGAALPAMAAGSVGVKIWLPALISLLIIWLLKLVVIVSTLYAVYRIVTHNETPLAALEMSLKTCAKNPVSVTVLAGVILLPLMLLAQLGYIVFLAGGLVALPVLITSVYASAKQVYG